ncbi:MAG: AAA family ATPase [Eubacteriales bacterium]|nr:AAA family ATPase [Eubacteriales bacterium]
MEYGYSQVDKENKKWFCSDITAKSLLEICMDSGSLRGLNPFTMEFDYPLSVISGKNGSGKSTLLALACCAYHNTKVGYIPSDRNKNYYTFSDFFIQTADEMKVEGLSIYYKSLNTWRNPKTKKISEGPGYQRRYKKKGGKWNKYEKRAARNVVFLGIQRIVPPSERKTEKTYSGKFKSTTFPEETKNKILEIASAILGRRYTSLDIRTVDRRRLFVVDRRTKHYSGFNMGAGENAIFSLLIEMFAAGRNSLIVVDEIELGLHEEAQKRLIEELKKLCKDLHCQIICSTHSGIIMDSVPPEGRFFIESLDNKTEIYKGISTGFAMNRLSGGARKELLIYTEDEVGKAVIDGCLPQDLRERVSVIPIGSDQAVLKQLSSAYRERDKKCVAFLDGDKRCLREQAKRQVKKHLELRTELDFEEWIEQRLCYLPGEVWPEKFLLELAITEIVTELKSMWRVCDESKVIEFLECALTAGKHKEFYELSQKLSQDVNVLRLDIIRGLCNARSDVFKDVSECILKVLGA